MPTAVVLAARLLTAGAFACSSDLWLLLPLLTGVLCWGGGILHSPPGPVWAL